MYGGVKFEAIGFSEAYVVRDMFLSLTPSGSIEESIIAVGGLLGSTADDLANESHKRRQIAARMLACIDRF